MNGNTHAIQPVARSDDRRTDFLATESPRFLLVVNGVFACGYLFMLLTVFPVGNPILYTLLIVGEIFHVWQVLTFLYTVWDTEIVPAVPAPHQGFSPSVDVFVTVAGEPVELVEETVRAAKAMRYPRFAVHILNDGFVARKENWREIEALAERLGVSCITRTRPGGAKAGNINNALRFTRRPLVACFDADHVPHSDFLEKTVPYFADASVAFVQTPQFYKNHDSNYLSQSSWEQQELFFGAICKGKNRLNAVPMCGTNMLIRRSALIEVGGLSTASITEDFVTGLFLHAKGYRSVYVPEVLAEGLACEDLSAYLKQQFRWARGSLDVMFRFNPLRIRGLTFAQRIQYLSSASFYLSGAVIAVDALLPVLYFYFGLVPVRVSGMLLAAVFLPYFLLTIYVIERVSNHTFTFSSLGFSMGTFPTQLRALVSAVTSAPASFGITRKIRQDGVFWHLVSPHLAYGALVVIGILVAYLRFGLSASLVNNAAWAGFSIAVFSPIVRAAFAGYRRPRAIPALPAARRRIPYASIR